MSLWFQVFGSSLIATTGVSTEVAIHATKYLNIRALAQPAALSIIVCQAGLLAQKDSVTPFATVALACAINIFGDYFLITVKCCVLLHPLVHEPDGYGSRYLVSCSEISRLEKEPPGGKLL